MARVEEQVSVAVLGSTGSIGTQTLDVIAAADDRYKVQALGAHRDVEALAAQAVRWRPEVVAIADVECASELKERIDPRIAIEAGPDAFAAVSRDADVVVNGVVGFAGLGVTIAALEAGHRLALANKESLIAAGPVVKRLLGVPGAEIVPVDSEHCAVHQCLRAGEGTRRLAEIILTASGGPFRGRSASELAGVGIDDALADPTWSMGPKISVDSSTLANKGLEVIEAHELFGVDYDRIDVVVHPESIVHSMATFTDGATIAQLSHPDMRLPIGYALVYPDRLDVAFGRIDVSEAMTLHFEPPDRNVFRCLDLAYAAGRAGETAPAWFSAANEVAVDAFLAGSIPWRAIAEVDDESLQRWDRCPADSIASVIEADRAARALTKEIVRSRAAREERS